MSSPLDLALHRDIHLVRPDKAVLMQVIDQGTVGGAGGGFLV